MNPNDYDEDGNNIVPCPICMSNYCPSKEDGKCPEEDDFARDMNMKVLLGEQWQTKFLNAGIEKGLGDLSMMIGIVSEILTANSAQARQAGKDEVVEKIEKYFKGLIFIPDPQATKDNLIKSLQDKK